jgi:hypothetical protein
MVQGKIYRDTRDNGRLYATFCSTLFPNSCSESSTSPKKSRARATKRAGQEGPPKAQPITRHVAKRQKAATRPKRPERATRAKNEPPSGEEGGATGATKIELKEAEGSEGLDVQEDDVKVGASRLEKVM